ncbi:MAG: transcription-repair coupling factor, partial [Desulfobulbaceae bacterium]|nr:transcription-repair coupling factor [Desulfobulbaceae bacterium]
PFIVVAPAEALLRRILPKDRLSGLVELVLRNEETDPRRLVNHLLAAGYEAVSLVQSVGEFSVRGGIIDLFAPGFDYPLRLDFFGDTVESIRLFDPITQRSVEEIQEAILLPASDILFPLPDSEEVARLIDRFEAESEERGWDYDEQGRIVEQLQNHHRFPGIEFFLPLFYQHPSHPLAFLPADTLICLHNPVAINQTVQLTRERIEANYREALAAKTPALTPDALFLNQDQLDKALAAHPLLHLHDFPTKEMEEEQATVIACGNHTLIKQEIELQRRQHGLLAPLAQFMRHWLDQGERVVFGCRSMRHAGHLAELLAAHVGTVSVCEPPLTPSDLAKPGVLLYGHPLSAGFDLPHEGLHVLSESELFGATRLGPKQKRQKGTTEAPLTFDELKIGDPVVHQTHGIGIYEGLLTMELKGIANDFLQIVYQDNDKLYVPVDRINSVHKYQGLSDKPPKIEKLGSKSWATAKKKVKEAVWKVAQDLLELYALRQMETREAFPPPDELFHELEESFPYDETPGQLKAINEVLDDLTSDRPMDRLVCGDVGYGKTEVAIRAAFKAIGDNRQVAVLVPTTVLAEQHAETFRERFQGFPVRVESLSRFRSAADQKKILTELTTGGVDVIIGTHRLLSKDVLFRRLGLLIIDEEHRFGVTHKEKLKKLRRKIDVLTLTATPIPRTLQLSLLGVRDLSVISSPPRHRRTVKTFVARYDDLVIKEAVTRELQRRGQVFLVHNRVQSIHEMARTVQKLVPEARVAVAHGQMPGKQLEEIMVRFVRKEIDVLVCTTIVESGLDIPNANTIIITRADRLGLAEIYQLRGRVGRSSEQAYAYLLVPSLDGLSRDAQQRLRALMDYNELGGGFKLAMSDLQIRGGGNILGESQSGTIAAVGYDLYLDLLQRTVEDLKRQAASGEAVVEEEEIDPEISLSIAAYIPASYINDPDQRYIAYRKISTLSTPEQLADLKIEFVDRYGVLPDETENLLAVVSLKEELRQLKIVKLEQGPATMVFSFHNRTPVAPEKILILIKQSKGKIRLTPDGRLVVQVTARTPDAILGEAKKILHGVR